MADIPLQEFKPARECEHGLGLPLPLGINLVLIQVLVA